MVESTYKKFSERDDIAYNVLSRRGLPKETLKRLYVALDGEYIPAHPDNPQDAYMYMAMQNGHPHGHPNGIDPFKFGRTKSYQNQGFHNSAGHDPFESHLNFGPDMPRPQPKERDDIEAERRRKMRPVGP